MLGYLLYQILVAPTAKICKNIVEKITDMAENELYGEDKIKTEIVKLQMMLEMEEITQEQYDEAESILMKRLEEGARRRQSNEM
ncbi:MAG: gas vesicle protein GvpG [Candidatus Hydromicrobium sp.]|nr:gas vesicle protein GvpG [Candidatus Hydromicrobium sp.]